MRKALCFRIFSLFCAVILFVSAIPQSIALTVDRLQDDFYAAVNAPWLTSTDLPDDRSSVSGFCELTKAVHQRLRMDFDSMDEADGALGQFLNYYAMASDYVTRDAQGMAPLLPYMQRILNLESLTQLDAELDQWALDGMVLPFSLYVLPDMGDSRKHALYAAAPSLLLPDVSYYTRPRGQALLLQLAETGRLLLGLAGIPEARKIVEDAIAFDQMLVPYAKPAEALSGVAQLYNPVPVEAFARCSSALDLESLAGQLLGVRPESVVLVNPTYFEAFSELVSEANFQKLRHWMLFRMVFDLSAYLDRLSLAVSGSYRMAITGQRKAQEPSELAFLLATEVYGGVVGDYYGRTYFGEEARMAVTAMVECLVETFQERLRQNAWLSPATIAAALRKLEALVINIGYPDTIDPVYGRFLVTDTQDGGTLLGNTMAFARIAREASFTRYSEPVDRSRWSITAHTVNAQYAPLANAITFPAAILQEPFYSQDQSESSNYGGIGAVIAHEITHAFDQNGAAFDAGGSLFNWWTEADYAAFLAKTEAMVALFDGIPHEGGFVSGGLTVSENIADAGGLATALQVVQSLPDGNLAEFFQSWAVIWRSKARPEYTELLLALDVHAPGKLRVNMQLGNLDAFYDAFDITEEDGMYIPPERRVTIW